MKEKELLQHVLRIKAIADIGLLYNKNDYDLERYNELADISMQLLQLTSGYSSDDLKLHFPLAKDYPTAKVDIRALILSPDKKN